MLLEIPNRHKEGVCSGASHSLLMDTDADAETALETTVPITTATTDILKMVSSHRAGLRNPAIFHSDYL